MIPVRIHQLLQAVPPHIPLYEQSPDAEAEADEPLCHQDVTRLAWALTDPQFPWAYAKAFAEAKLPLPAVVTETVIRDAHKYLISGKCSDNLLGALVLCAAPMKLKRALVESLLLISPALTLERIGELVCLPVEEVQAFESLFFSVRDRANDQCFRTNIAYPNTRQVEFQKGYLAMVDPCDLLKRAAIRGGVDVVMELMGALTSESQLSDKEYARIVRTNILSEAALLAEAGLVHQDLPIFKLADKLIRADMKAAARAPAAATRVGARAESKSLGGSVLDVATVMATVPVGESSAPKWLYLAPSQEASDVSDTSDASEVSDRSAFNDMLRNPDLSVSIPLGLRRPISCDLATPNRSLSEAVIA